MKPIFQIGILVQDLDRAMKELGEALDISWGTVGTRTYQDWEFRIVFSREGPPFIEMIEGPPGSPWDASGGSRLDHLQCWTEDMADDSRRFEAAGLTLDADGLKLGGSFRYFRSPSTGMRLELIDSARKADYRARWGID